MTVDEAIAIVKSKAKGRTRYAEQPGHIDEILVEEIEYLRYELEKARERYYARLSA